MKKLVLVFLLLPLPALAAPSPVGFHSCVAQDSAGAHVQRCFHILY
jgi:hypothetical protein